MHPTYLMILLAILYILQKCKIFIFRVTSTYGCQINIVRLNVQYLPLNCNEKYNRSIKLKYSSRTASKLC